VFIEKHHSSALPDVAGKAYWKRVLFPEESGNAISVYVSVQSYYTE